MIVKYPLDERFDDIFVTGMMVEHGFESDELLQEATNNNEDEQSEEEEEEATKAAEDEEEEDEEQYTDISQKGAGLSNIHYMKGLITL